MILHKQKNLYLSTLMIFTLHIQHRLSMLRVNQLKEMHFHSRYSIIHSAWYGIQQRYCRPFISKDYRTITGKKCSNIISSTSGRIIQYFFFFEIISIIFARNKWNSTATVGNQVAFSIVSMVLEVVNFCAPFTPAHYIHRHTHTHQNINKMNVQSYKFKLNVSFHNATANRKRCT